MSPQTALDSHLTTQRYCAVKARRARFMQRDEDVARYWHFKAMAAHYMALIVIDQMARP